MCNGMVKNLDLCIWKRCTDQTLSAKKNACHLTVRQDGCVTDVCKNI